MIRLAAFLGFSLFCAACASSSSDTARAASAAAAQAVQEVPTEGLPAQRLNAGECGLFLWSMTAPRKFVFFTKASASEAQVWHEGKALPLQMVDSHGDIFGQFMTGHDYITRDGALEVGLNFTPGERLEQGQRISSGRLVIRAGDGWETVQPVSGVSACMPG
ncbi:MAG: hypothetical protein ACK46Q_02100 [Hyphomonas sp.]